ncbi:DUF4290 domain-containing protein [Owenweeksia hongkongensis]|uniref:DUF4290 domain-containing protein n=1 Tax=Owenweeksia hongkongensis (strain DSM 17368 / CIP 108786 / JCM 12287 / NRRL B-23963 / UST20020801) TaxID=926562 RepID=G8R2J4_OWEHD|nr:DUF4290 domain-containing protein [Owenweeksia hongkongensis]AEV34006.1 hypothetical protein Oweho_3051 [Owenweeksia hongkongensis DSM 17368]
MEYNTSLPHLIIPEYGRNVQKMVGHLLTIEDKEERNRQAQNLIDIIGNLNPQIRDVPDFKHKLWDHLFIMSDFKLDVDSPYPKPSEESLKEKPELVPYPRNNRRYRHYGNVIRKMIDYAVEQPPGEEKEKLKIAIANHMKKTYLIWNKDTVDDEVILMEMNALANGKLKLDDMNLKHKQELVKDMPNNKRQHHSSNNKNRRSGKKRYKK